MPFTSSPKRLQTVVFTAWIIVDHSMIRSVSPGGEMLSQHSRSSKLAFGPFEFDPGSGELFRHGSRVRLASQPGTVLDALVDRPGELVTREHLRTRLWPGVTSGQRFTSRRVLSR